MKKITVFSADFYVQFVSKLRFRAAKSLEIQVGGSWKYKVECYSGKLCLLGSAHGPKFQFCGMTENVTRVNSRHTFTNLPEIVCLELTRV